MVGVRIDSDQAAGLSRASGVLWAHVEPGGVGVDLQGASRRERRRVDGIPIVSRSLATVDQPAGRMGNDIDVPVRKCAAYPLG